MHDPHAHLDGAAVCPGVLAPPKEEDLAWLGVPPTDPGLDSREPRDPFGGLPPIEVWLIFLAQLTGAGVAFLCAEILPRPWGLIVFLIVNAALAANIGRILLKSRSR